MNNIRDEVYIAAFNTLNTAINTTISMINAAPGIPTVSMTTYTAVPGSPTADSLALLGTWAQSQEEL